MFFKIFLRQLCIIKKKQDCLEKTFKRWFEINDLDPHSSNFVDPDTHAINADPHHYSQLRL